MEVLNINKGCNAGIMEACEALRDYADFVDGVRVRRLAGESLTAAVDASTRERMAAGGPLAGYLGKHRAEVVDTLLEEYDFDEHMKVVREEAREDARLEMLERFIDTSGLDFAAAADALGVEGEERAAFERALQHAKM